MTAHRGAATADVVVIVMVVIVAIDFFFYLYFLITFLVAVLLDPSPVHVPGGRRVAGDVRDPGAC